MAVKQTPLIAQYLSVKQRVPDAILFFRLGDFYEMFFEDAEVGAAAYVARRRIRRLPKLATISSSPPSAATYRCRVESR